MMDKPSLLVFTDLDGTLIDHETYKWDNANKALSALKRISAGIILASSKTAAEVSTLRTALALDQWPAIVENGAGMLPPHVKSVKDNAQYQALRSILENLPQELRVHFQGFGDASATEVAAITGLPLKDAELAKKRDFSEPGLWDGTDAQKSDFLAHLKQHGATAQQGGRFLTLSFGRNKVDQMRAIIKIYQPKHTIALGDAPNDVNMIKHAEFGVIVANPHRPPLPTLKGEDNGHITRTKAVGPLGWNTAILNLLDRLELH